MNTFGCHSLVWSGGWTENDARHAIESSSKAGYDLVEIAAIDPASVDIDMTRRLLEEYDMGATVSLGLSAETDVSSEDPEAVSRGRELLSDALNIVRGTGGKMLCGVIYSKLGKYDTPVTERGLENSRATMAWLADKAADSGISLGIEFANRYETNVVNTTAQTLAFIDSIGRDNVYAHLDSYHMNIEERSFAEAIQLAASAGKLGYVHVGESHRGALGTGSINWTEFFAALAEAKYDGVITFESFSSKVVHESLSNSLAIWRNLWEDNVELATTALSFMQQGLADARTGVEGQSFRQPTAAQE
ncbi:sugar phosphate isomerase/epimerase family protein [Arthrobacter psychrolactophilus]